MARNREYYNVVDKNNRDGVKKNKKKKKNSLDGIATISDSDVFLVVYDAHIRCVNIF